jgi:hypothetical protein
MLIAPRWWLAVLAGATVAVAHLAKASVLPALAIWIAVSLAQILWNLRVRRDSGWNDAWRRVGMLMVVIATFLTVLFPYIRTSKRIYGQYFYNVNSTFVMWCDSSSEAWEFLSAHGDKDQWRSLPADQLPSFAKYWREHSVPQIVRRLTRGSLNLATQNAMLIGYYKFVVALIATGAVLWVRRSGRARQLLADKPFAALFCVLFFTGYFLLYAWYDTIVNDTRFVLSIFLPFVFAASIFVLRMGRDRMITLASRSLPFEQFFAGVLLALALIDVLYNSASLAV